MAAKHINIDVNDAAYNTNAPFMWECPLRLGDINIPAASFVSIKIQVPEECLPPVSMYKISTGTTTDAVVEFRDSTGQTVGFWYINTQTEPGLDYITAFIYDDCSTVVGHVMCKPDVPALLVAGKNTSETGTIYTNSGDFVLMSKCHTASLIGACKAFNINGSIVKDDITLAGEQGAVDDSLSAIYTDDSGYSINVHGLYSDPNEGVADGIRFISVNGELYNVEGKHLLLRHSETSNLRVVCGTDSITMKGVLDE